MNILKSILLTSVILFSWMSLSAQNDIDSSDRANKFISLEIGPKINLRATPDTLAGSGFGVMIDYGWQVGGLKGKKRRSFISIPLGYSFIVDNKNREISRQLNYGWAVSHELSKDSNFVPFLGYGLLLNQYYFDGIKGSLFGHQSRFEFGINYFINSRWGLYGKLDYSYIRLPVLGESKSKSIHQTEVKFGAKFNF